MKSLRRFLFWTCLFLVLLAGIDQLLVRVPTTTPGISHFQRFYRDFRTRLFGLVETRRPATIDRVIEQSAPTQDHPVGSGRQQRYIYVDGQGQLQFADSLEEIPKNLRGQAQPLKE